MNRTEPYGLVSLTGIISAYIGQLPTERYIVT